MPLETLLDYLPLWLLFALTIGYVVGGIAIGFALGDRRRRALGDGGEKPKPGAVGPALGLLAFLLAFNFSLAAGRYEKRGELLQLTATSVRSAQLYAERLPGDDTEAFRVLLSSYVDTRLDLGRVSFDEQMATLNSLLDRIWVAAGEIAAENPTNPNSRLLLMEANRLVQNHEKAIWSALYNRIPTVTWSMLYLMVMFGMLALGYEAGITAARYRVVTTMLALSFSTVLLLVAALDRPANGMIKIDQQSMQDVQAFLKRHLAESGVEVVPAPTEAESGIALYSGGPILTMIAGSAPAEAIAVLDGRILAVGTRAEVLEAIGEQNFAEVDLEGHTMLPGFIDPHSHFSMVVQIAPWANVSAPPIGTVDDKSSLLEVLKKRATDLKEEGWLFAFGYDETTLPRGLGITVKDLDPLFPERPVVLLHVSGHGAVLNSAALAHFGIDEDSEAPEGGVIGRLPGSRKPSGLLMESAWLAIYPDLPKPTESARFSALGETVRAYASHGYTTCHDGAASLADLDFLRGAAAAGQLSIDVVAMLLYTEMSSALERPDLKFGEYSKRLKTLGFKALLDGSPQGRTAFFSEPYLVPGPSGEENWTGESTIPYEEYLEIFQAARAAGLPLSTHVNGDAAIDLLIQAHRDAGVTAADGLRSVAVHSQFIRPDQLDAFRELGITPSFFTNHVYYWGDAHIRQLGLERAAFLSPLKAAKERGIRFTNHTDSIVTPLDPMMTIWTAVARETRRGEILGADQQVSVETALRALTANAAWQIHEEQDKGTLVEGKLADFVILSANPLEVETDQLREVRVLETIKEGRTVYLDE